MKILVIYTLFLFSMIALISPGSRPAEGPHGGILKPSEGYYIEMKNDLDTSIAAYLLNKKLKTVSNKDISGEVKFYFPDSTTLNVDLKRAPGDGFTGRIAPGFHSCKITFLLSGKPISAMFEKQNQIAQKKQ